MTNSTTDTYEIKRKIMSFSNKLANDVGNMRLVLVYGLGAQPMMLATNKSILGKRMLKASCVFMTALTSK